MANKRNAPVLPRLEHTRDPKYNEIYATGAFGGFDSQGGFHIIFYSPNKKLESLSEGSEQVVEISHKVKVIITPQTLKHLVSWLNKSMAEYEEKFGKIQEPILVLPTKIKMSGAHPPETMYG